MCFWCSKEPSHWDVSFEYPQHMFWTRNKENSFSIRTLIWRSVWFTYKQHSKFEKQKYNLLWHNAVKMSQNGDQFFCFLELRIFSFKLGKHTFCHWEHDPITVIKMDQNTCLVQVLFAIPQHVWTYTINPIYHWLLTPQFLENSASICSGLTD